MTQSETEINLDEVEASIKRCEEFLAANEIDFSMKPAARPSYYSSVTRRISDEPVYPQYYRATVVSSRFDVPASALKPSDDEIYRVIRDSRNLYYTIQRSYSAPKYQHAEQSVVRSVKQPVVQQPQYPIRKEVQPEVIARPKLYYYQRSAELQPDRTRNAADAPAKKAHVDFEQKKYHYTYSARQPARLARDKIAEHYSAAEPSISTKASRLSDSYKTVSTSYFAVNTPQPAHSDDTIKEFRLTSFEYGPMISTQREQMIYQRKQQKPSKNYKTQQKIEQIRKDLQEKEMKECTFYPQINSTGYRATLDETADRLYYQSYILQQQREMYHYEKEREIAQKCSFYPYINQKSRELATKQTSAMRVEDRMLAANEQMRMRMNLLYQYKEYEDLTQNRPVVSEEHKRKRDMLVDRRRRRIESGRDSRAAVVQQMLYDEELECTHYPQINHKSQQLASRYPDRFEERAKVWEERKYQKIEQIRQDEEKKVTGTPSITSTVALQQTGLQQAHERLYLDAQIRQYLRNSSTRASDLLVQDEECTFSPKIAAESAKLVCNKTYNLYQDAIAMHYNKLQRQKELQAMKEDEEANQPFQPRVSSFAKYVQSHYDFKNPDVLMAQIQDEQEEREILRRTKQLEQQQRTQELHMRDKPAITVLDKRIYNPQQVQGLDAYMDKVYRYRALENEKRYREAKAFGYGYNWYNKQTVTEEFALSAPQKGKSEFVEVKAFERTTDYKMRDLVGAILRSEI